MTDRICGIVSDIRRQKPLIHCITNPISINQCANAILSVGAKPIMAEHPKEVEEITDRASALMLNTGNITDVRMKSMFLSAQRAKSGWIPILVDAVGVACSRLRRGYSLELMDKFCPTVVKGNYSEIYALYDQDHRASGVDAEYIADNDSITSAAKALACRYNAVILATGKTDLITDGIRTVTVNNGTAELADITGTGCMLGSLCTAFMTSAQPLDAVVSACCYFGICGELATKDRGLGSFYVSLMDKLSTLEKSEISENLKVEGW